MNKFSYYASLLLVATTTLLASCEKDDVTASINLSQQAVYFSELGDSRTISYTGNHIEKISVNEDTIPEGWDVSIKKSSKKITIYGPTTQEDFDSSLTSSSITFTAISKDDLTGSDYLTVGTTENSEDISDKQSNSYIVTKANTIYSFDATLKGESDQTIAPSKVEVLWQTYPSPISYARLNGDKVEFHINADEEDHDEDGLTDDVFEGNAVIAASDSKGNILWSWHIWISDDNIEDHSITINGIELLDRNLGALNNSNASESDILASYGLYYQWGRKDPFVKPAFFNAAGGTDASMRNEFGSARAITYAATTASKGTVDYAIRNPLTYLLGVEASNYNWVYTNADNELWSSTKSIYDPCPKGWKVASPELYEGLTIPTLSLSELEAMTNDYGWNLTDERGESTLFMGLGRRGYITGKIQNVNLNESNPKPWSGYYWTTGSNESSTKSTAMYFSFDADKISGNEIYNSTYYRANGMQIRCQRDQQKQ